MSAQVDTIATLAARLVSGVQEVARAEIDLVRVRTSTKVAGYKTPVILFAVAGVLAMAALPALLVGLILTIGTVTGPGWATLIVIGAVGVIVLILAKVAQARLKAAV